MRLISAGSVVQLHARPPLSESQISNLKFQIQTFAGTNGSGLKPSNLQERTCSLTIAHRYINKAKLQFAEFFSSLKRDGESNFVIKLLRAYGECLGAKRR